MKKYLLTIAIRVCVVLVMAGTVAKAQNAKPKDFLLVPASGSVTVSNGQTAQLNLGLPRAGFYKKDVIKLKANHDVQGLTVQLDPADSSGDAVVVKFSAQGVAPGTYGVTLVGTSGIVTRGTTVQILVQ